MSLFAPETRGRWIVACVIALVAARVADSYFVTPLEVQREASEQIASGLRARVARAQATIAGASRAEAQAAAEQKDLATLLSTFPKSPVMVWLPQRIKAHFSRSGISDVVVRHNTTRRDVTMPDFERTFWAVEMPLESGTERLRESCLAIAEIEPLEKSIRVLDVSIQPDAEVPSRHLVVLNLSVLSPRAEVFR